MTGEVARETLRPRDAFPPEGEDRDMAPRTDSKTAKQDADQRSPGDRITVALIPKAAEELQRLQSETGMSKTDIVNRAISLYKFFQSQINANNDVIVRDGKTGETQLVRFL